MTADAANPRFGSVARLSFGMPKNAVKPTFRTRKARSTQGGDNLLPMVADWEILSKSEVHGSVGTADRQKTKSRIETVIF